MPQQTPAQARVIDPILTEVARSVAVQSSPVADVLFPLVPVGARAGRIISFGNEDFRLVNSARAPGSNTKRVQFGYSSGNFSLVDYSLEGSVPIELLQEGQEVPGLDHARMAITKVRNMQALEREKQCADLALNAASYAAGNKITLTSTDRWDVYDNAASDPIADIQTGREAVRAQIGVRPNVLTLGPKVLTSLRSHPKILDRLSTASDRPPATLAQLAALLEIDRVVEGGMIYHNGTAFADVWGTFALLAYVTPRSMQEMGSPSFGYTYQLRDYPVAEESYYGRNEKTWYFPVTDARQPVLAGASAGYLITTAVS
jgi:hypothetical protein